MNLTTTPQPGAAVHDPATPASHPRTVGEMVLDAAARYRGVALEYRRDGQRISVSYPELGTRVTESRGG